MANATIKITQLPNIGNNLGANTLLPVVDTTGTAVTDKVTVGNIANFILTEAGNLLPEAFVSQLSYSVANAAQPNITSVGTLNINTLHISGGTNGQYLQTDGDGGLSWVSGGGSGNGEVGGANTQIQFNDAGNFGGDPELTWDAGNNQLNTVNFAASHAIIYGNVDVVNVNATGNLVPNAIYTDHYYYANGYVFGGGGGNGAPSGSNTQVQFNDNGAFGGNTGFTFNKTTGIFTSPFLAGNGNGLSNIQGANVSGAVGLATYAGTANSVAGANVSGAVSYAGTANSVAVGNVVGIGNIATVALNGNGSQVLLGNGTWGNAGAGSSISNGISNVNIPTSGGAVEVTAGTQHWAFGTDGTLTAPNDSQIVPAGNNFNLYTYGVNGAVQFFTDVSGNNHNWAFDGYGYTNLPFSQGYSNTAVIATVGAGNIMLQAGAGPTKDFLFGSDGSLNLPEPGTIRGAGPGTVNAVSDDFVQLQWVDTGNLNISNPNDTLGPTNWLYVESGGIFIETNKNANLGNTTYSWNFNTAGNTEMPGNVTIGTSTGSNGVLLQTNQIDYGFYTDITGITNGNPTVIVTLNNVEFPGPVTGSVRITGVLGETEANGFWYWQAVDTNVIQLYTDSTLTTPADGTTWSAYTGGGIAVSSGYNNLDIIGGNVAIQSGAGKYWSFNPDGGFVPPTMTINLHNGGNQQAQVLQLGDPTHQAVITGPTPGYNTNAQRLIIQGQRGSGSGEGGDVYFWAGDSDVNGGDIKIYAGDADVSGYGGYVNIDAGSGVGGGGQLTLTGGYSSGGQGGQITITPGYSGDAAGAQLSLNGGQGSGDGGPINIQAGYGGANGGQVTITGGGSALGLAQYGNVVVQSGVSSWTFDNLGTVTFPDTTLMGAIEGANTFGFYNANATNFLIEGPNNVTWSFNTGTGVLTVPGEGIIQSFNDTVILQSVDSNSNIYSARLDTNGGLYFETTAYPTGWLSLTNNSGNANITAATGTAGGAGKHIYINAGDADQSDYYTSAGGNINITGGLGAFNDGGGGGPGGSINITAGNSSDPAGVSGNINITSSSHVWTFDNGGSLTVPGPIMGDGLNLYGESTAESYAFITIPNNTNSATTPIHIGNDNGNVDISTINQGTSATYHWTYDNTGNLTLPGNTFAVNYANGTQVSLGGGYGDSNVVTLLSSFGSNTITTTGNVSVGNIIGNGHALTDITGANVTGAVAYATTANSVAVGNVSGLGNIATVNKDGNASNVLLGNGVFGAIPSSSIIANGNSNVTIATAAGNVVTNVNGSTLLTVYSGGIKVGGSGIIQSPGGASSIILNNNGANIGTANITLQLNVTGANGANVTANLTAGNISTSGNISGNTNGYAIGYLNIPQVAASNTTITLSDAGKHYYSTTAGNLTLTIPNNATTSFATGTAISIVVQAAGNVLVNAASGVTLYMAGSSTAGNRTVGTYGMATLMKVASDTWFINGTGVY